MERIKALIIEYKTFIIGAVVIILAWVGYTSLIASDTPATALSGEDKSITNSELGRDIVITLNKLKTIAINPEFFEDPLFRDLIDFSVEIQKQPVGKTNPFLSDRDLLGGDDSEAAAAPASPADLANQILDQLVEESG